MCFSAAGSFVLSGILTGIGAASLANNPSPRHRMFAAIPFIFAAQQAAEGMVWLTLGPGPATMPHRAAVAVFLAMALVIWPMWLPLSLRQVERRPARRATLTTLFGFGCGVAAYAAYLMTRWQPIAHATAHSMSYDYGQNSDTARPIVYLLAYVVPTIVPFFVSTLPLTRTMGITLIGSLVVTILVRREALTSIWCFFAAVLSALLFVALSRERRVVTVPGVPSPVVP
jgi:hypothetical protein